MSNAAENVPRSATLKICHHRCVKLRSTVANRCENPNVRHTDGEIPIHYHHLWMLRLVIRAMFDFASCSWVTSDNIAMNTHRMYLLCTRLFGSNWSWSHIVSLFVSALIFGHLFPLRCMYRKHWRINNINADNNACAFLMGGKNMITTRKRICWICIRRYHYGLMTF